MKIISEKLEQYLHSRNNYISCDLYEFRLSNGDILRFADFDTDVTVNHHTYKSNGPIFRRNQIKLSSKVSVDKLDITLSVDTTDKLHTVPLMVLAHNGGLDDAEMSLKRAFFDDGAEIVGYVDLFTGYVEIKQGGGLDLQLWVKSEVQRLNIGYPNRKYYPNCPYSVFSKECGISINDYRKQATVQSVSSDSRFTIDISSDNGYYDMGGIEWLTGKLLGQTSAIKKSYANGTIELLIPTDIAPSIGDKVMIYPGCDKQPSTCRNKFNNWKHNCATPYVPRKESVR